MRTKHLLVAPGMTLALMLICVFTLQLFAAQTDVQAEPCTGQTSMAPAEVEADWSYLPVQIGAADVSNGDFEGGTSVWTEYSALGWPLIVTSTILPVTPHSGDWAVWLGGDDDEVSTISQTVAITIGESTLSYWQWIDSEDICGNDFGQVLINNTQVYSISLCDATNTNDWVNRTLDLSAYIGQNVDLQFRAETNGNLNSNLFIDDVSLGQENYVYLPIIGRNSCGFYYFDDFSDPNSGWFVVDDSERTYAYLNGEFQMLLKKDDYHYFLTPDLVLPGNYRIEVDVYQPSNSQDHGLVFGTRQNGDAWETYQFLVYPPTQEYFLVKRYMNGTWVTLINWTYNPEIYQDTPNHLRVDRVGTLIRLYINNVQVGSVTDASFTGAGRDAGLRVYSGDSAPVDTRFDNFRATCLP
ncbi:MAG: hypothetical protein JXM69_21855 [Anaerolineae bacterium]|nr:hypothetical protein [Anaerolineae bacterium]